MDIHELLEYQLYQLKSIDPALSSNWREVIQEILPELNVKSQNSLHKNILEPRGIYIDSDQNLTYQRRLSLKQTLSDIQTNNNDLMSIAANMLKIVDSSAKSYRAKQLADEIEIIFAHLGALNLNNVMQDQINYKIIRTAFLYDLAQWIDTVHLEVEPGLRGLDAHMVTSYLKEVFIKQKIQDQDFRKWSSSDVSFQEFTYLPTVIRNEGKSRKFIVVEGQAYWYLIGSPNEPNKNPYSFRRFLHEDSSGKPADEYIYLTHAVIKKHEIDNPKYLSHIAYIMSRFYTLDNEVPDTLLNFTNEIQMLNKTYLKPLLKKRIEQGVGSIEDTIKERMVNYEKQVSVLILGKLPRIIPLTLHSKHDRDYLFYNLDQLIKQMIENVQDFRLQPLAMYSTSSEIMSLKLIAIRKLLIKTHTLLCTENISIEECSEVMSMPQIIIQEALEKAEASIRELDELIETVFDYWQVKKEGTLWQKITLGVKPQYTLEEIAKSKLAVQENVFASIIRLAKERSNGIIYLEFECEEVMNENYRHYALADGTLGISRLPKILRLPEDRTEFDINAIKKVINQNVFEAHQAWDI